MARACAPHLVPRLAAGTRQWSGSQHPLRVGVAGLNSSQVMPSPSPGWFSHRSHSWRPAGRRGPGPGSRPSRPPGASRWRRGRRRPPSRPWRPAGRAAPPPGSAPLGQAGAAGVPADDPQRLRHRLAVAHHHDPRPLHAVHATCAPRRARSGLRPRQAAATSRCGRRAGRPAPPGRTDRPAGRGTAAPGGAAVRSAGPECGRARSPPSAPRRACPPGRPRACRLTASVVRNSAAIDAAFCSAERVTLAASMMPALVRSSYSPVAALRPSLGLSRLRFMTTTPPVEAGVHRDLLERLLQRPGHDAHARGLVGRRPSATSSTLGRPQQRGATAGHDALLDGGLGRRHRVLDAVLLLLQLDLGGRTDLEHRHAAGQLGHPLLSFSRS